MSARLVVTVAPDGQIHAHTEDVTGPSCMNYIALLEDLLDAETVQSAFTADYTAMTAAEPLVQETRHDTTH